MTGVSFPSVDGDCIVDTAESFSLHSRRCRCDFLATQWALFADLVKGRSPEENPPVWASSPESAGAYLADATAEAFAALNRVVRLADEARGHLTKAGGDPARVRLGVALDRYLVEADELIVRAADARRELVDILHEGEIG